MEIKLLDGTKAEIEEDAPLGLATFPPKGDLPYEKWETHYFVRIDDRWKGVSLKTFNELLADGHLMQNVR
jgi:hypothetical protein